MRFKNLPIVINACDKNISVSGEVKINNVNIVSVPSEGRENANADTIIFHHKINMIPGDVFVIKDKDGKDLIGGCILQVVSDNVFHYGKGTYDVNLQLELRYEKIRSLMNQLGIDYSIVTDFDIGFEIVSKVKNGSTYLLEDTVKLLQNKLKTDAILKNKISLAPVEFSMLSEQLDAILICIK